MSSVRQNTAAVSSRLGGIWKTVLSRRTVAWLCAACFGLTLVPLIAAAFDAHPVYDDFLHTAAASEAWARTGGLGQTLAAAWDRMAVMYQTWQGTFAAMFLSALQPMVFSARLFFLTPLATLGALLLAGAYFFKELVRRTLGADQSAAVIAYTAFMTLLIQFVPGVGEVLYWQSGTPYTFSVTVIFLILGLLLKLRRPQRAALLVWRCLALVVCGVLLGGCPYPLALSGLVAAVLLCAWSLLARSRARLGSLALLAGVAAALLAVVLAPGNAVRQERVGEPMSPVSAILQSVAESLETSGQWFGPQLIAVCALVLPFLLKPARECSFSFRRPVWFTLLCFGVLAAGFVPPIYATGVEGYRVERVLTSLYMLYAVLTPLVALYWLGWLSRRPGCLPPRDRNRRKYPTGAPVWLLALCAAFLAWGLFSSAIMATPSIAAARSLLTGEAARYDAEMSQREQAIASAANRAEAIQAIDALSLEPSIYPPDLLPFQKESSVADVMHRYYRLQALCSQYGAGRIPQDEWEALDAWARE